MGTELVCVQLPNEQKCGMGNMRLRDFQACDMAKYPTNSGIFVAVFKELNILKLCHQPSS